ncbi:MAG: hypothetical protein ACTSXJ_03485 [Candidatus Baldrarchaeia archaeon]
MSLEGVALRAIELGADRIILVSVYKGNPGKMHFFEVSSETFKRLGPDMLLAGVKLQRDLGIRSLRRHNSLGVVTTGSANNEIRKLADALGYILKSEVYVLDSMERAADLREEKGLELILKVEEDRRSLAALSFYSLLNEKIVGPIIRVKKLFWEPKVLLIGET